MKCPKCETEQSGTGPDCEACGVVFSRYQPRPATPPPPPKPFVSTCDIPAGFEPVDTVFVVRHADKPAFGAMPLTDVMAATANDLKTAALKAGGHAVAGAVFQVLGANVAAIDVLGWGTAIRQVK